MKNTLLAIGISFLHARALAETLVPKSDTSFSKHRNFHTISLNIGTTGVGMDFKQSLGKTWVIRGGGSFFNISAATQASSLLGTKYLQGDCNISFQSNNLHIMMEYPVFHQLRLVGGLGYFLTSKITMDYTPPSDVVYNHVNIPKAEIGTCSMSLEAQGISPYLGISLFRAQPRKGFGCSVDLGTFFISQNPTLHISASKLLASKADWEPIIQEKLNGFHYLPNLQLNFNIKI